MLLQLKQRGDQPLEEQLRQAVLDVPQLKCLPEVAAVVPDGSGQCVRGISDNPLVVLAVLARSSASVFIRHKQPVITAAGSSRCLTLLVPADAQEKQP